MRINDGKNITIKATANLNIDDLVKFGDIIGVCTPNISSTVKSGEDYVLETFGVFETKAVSTDVIAQGDILYFVEASKSLSKDSNSGANIRAGIALNGSGNGVATVRARLN